MGKIAVIPTDTIYGIVSVAFNKDTVEKIYKLRKRNPTKPFIILISSLKDLKHFGIVLTQKQKDLLQKIWPNPVSVILPVKNQKWSYLHRGTKTLAFRVPDKKDLLELLKQTGPLIAPSANFEGEKPSTTIKEAKNYFGDSVSIYIDGGELDSYPSTLIKIENGQIEILRQGAFKHIL